MGAPSPVILSPALFFSCASMVRGPKADPKARWTSIADPDLASVALIDKAGYWAHYDPRTGLSYWPLPTGGNTQSLAEFGEDAAVLGCNPEFGDIHLMRVNGSTLFGRCGIVADVSLADKADGTGTEVRVSSLTIDVWSTDGRPVLELMTLSPEDRYIRWAELDRRRGHGNPTARTAGWVAV